MNYLVIHHARCADGLAAALAIARWFDMRSEAGDEIEFFAGDYNAPPPNVAGKTVFLVDFSYRADVVRCMLAQAESVTILDHHKSALLDLQPLFEEGLQGAFDLEHSGCIVAWRWAFGEATPPRLFLHIEDRDLWRFELPHTREIIAWLTSFPYGLEVWDALVDEFEREGDTSALIQGRAILRKHDKDVAELVALTKQRIVLSGHDVPAANLPPTMASDAGHLLAPGEPFAAIFWADAKGLNISLRSDEGGLDVSMIAQLYGGGGHKRAAGFSLPGWEGHVSGALR